MSPSIAYVVFLLIILCDISSGNPVNQSVCILPTGQQFSLSPQQLAQLQLQGKSQGRTEQQQIQAEQAPILDGASTTPPSPTFWAQQNDAQGQPQRTPTITTKGLQRNLTTPRPGQKQSPATVGRSNFWNLPPNKTSSSQQTGYDSNVASLDEQRRLQPFDRNRDASPLSPIYDRSGFRREPLHPSYGGQPTIGQRVPSLLPVDQAIFRSSAQRADGRSPDPWNRFSRTPPDSTTSSPFDATPSSSPSFFDPTRRPKIPTRDSRPTTRRPFFESNPGSTKEPTTPQTPVDSQKPQSGIPRPGSSDPDTQTVPEYAYIKQPISKILDEPDLELEGKPVKFGIMKDALDRVGLLDLADGPGPVTIFCPTDDAFRALDNDVLTEMQQNPSYLRNTMLRHIVTFDVPPESLRNGIVIPSYSGEPLIINVVSGGKLITVRGTPIIAATNAQNGVIYVINKVMTDEPTNKRVLDELFPHPERRIQNDGNLGSRQFGGVTRRDSRTQVFTGTGVGHSDRFSIPTRNRAQEEFERRTEKEAPKAGEEDQETTVRFYRWLSKSGFLDVLENTGNNYTVVLPVDKAVNRLPLKYQTTLEDNPRQLESLLMYHIVPGAVNLTRLKDEEGIPTVSGRNIRVSLYPSHKKDGKNTTSLSGAQIIGDSKTPNGKIRFLITDRVMYPPQGNLFDVISRSPILKSLANLIKVANLETGLSDTGPFTLFAPSDEAFLKLPPESLDYLAHDPQSSRAFLLRHIVRPVLFTSSIPMNNATVLESTTGERLQLTRSKDVVKVDGVAVKFADITATNGVIHVIDHVL